MEGGVGVDRDGGDDGEGARGQGGRRVTCDGENFGVVAGAEATVVAAERPAEELQVVVGGEDTPVARGDVEGVVPRLRGLAGEGGEEDECEGGEGSEEEGGVAVQGAARPRGLAGAGCGGCRRGGCG